MNNKKNNASRIGGAIGKILGSVTTVFIALRACVVIRWPWFWVLFPTLLAWGIGALVFLITGAAVAVAIISEDKN
jgi:hypothetical protein